MNIASLMLGDVLGTAIESVGSKILQDIKPLDKGDFFNTLLGQSRKQLSIQDLQVSRETGIQLLELRDFALKQGHGQITVSINDQEYLMNTQNFTFEKVS